MSADPSQAITPSGPSTSQIPDLIKIGSVPSDTSIDVETSILEPVSFSQEQAHFVLANKGILHSNSRITFACDNASFGVPLADGMNNVFFPAGVGVGALIQRCRLSIGGKTVSEIEDFNHFFAYESIFVAPETAKEREQVFTSRIANSVVPNLNERVDEQGRYTNASNNASNTESVTQARSSVVDNGRDLDYANGLDEGALERTDEPQPSKYAHIWQNQDHGNKPIFSILLADLFPFLKMNQLPLYMIDEQVSITLTFSTKYADGVDIDSERISYTSDESATQDYNIDQNHLKLVADYIYYPQEMMEAYRSANADMNFTYVDYQHVKRTVQPADMSAVGGLIQNLGGAGRIVNKVFIGLADDTESNDSVLNRYAAMGPENPPTATTCGSITTNLRYNDLFLYPIDVTNYARHFHNVFSAEGRMPMLPRGWYSGEGTFATGSTDDDDTESYCQYEEYGSLDSFAGCFLWTCYRLNRNERVNSRGIELYDRRVTNTEARTLRAWLQVVRLASLKDGVITVTYA